MTEVSSAWSGLPAAMRNPELRRLYGKSLRGGAAALRAARLRQDVSSPARWRASSRPVIAVSFADIIDMFVGQSERNIHELFEIARRNAP